MNNKNMVINAFIDSVLHLIALRAYLKKLFHEGYTINGTVSITKIAVINKTFSDEDLDSLSKYGLKIVIKENKKNTLLKKYFIIYLNLVYYCLCHIFIKKNDNISFLLILPSQFFINISEIIQIYRKYGNHFKIVLLEEGVGSYIRNAIRWLSRGFEKTKYIKHKIILLRKEMRYFIKYKFLIRALEKSNKIENFYILENSKSGFIPNKIVCKYFYEVFKELASKMDINSDLYNNVVLINTQPFFEEMDSNQDIDCYKNIAEICRYLNIKLVLKPHPREKNLERYSNINLVIDRSNNSIAQEIILAKAKEKPLAIVGFFSTTLVTSKIFFDIPAISLGNLIDVSKLSFYGNDIKNFMTVFKNVVSSPKTFDELRTTLKNQYL